jgi:hypothetical protein
VALKLIRQLVYQQAEGIQNDENANIHHVGQSEAINGKRFKLGGGQIYYFKMIKLPL